MGGNILKFTEMFNKYDLSKLCYNATSTNRYLLGSYQTLM